MKELQLQTKGVDKVDCRIRAHNSPRSHKKNNKRKEFKLKHQYRTNLRRSNGYFNTEKMSEGAQFSSLLKYPTYMAVLAAHLLFIYCFQNKKTRSNSYLKLLSY